MKKNRKKHNSGFKVKVAIEALKERESLQELSHRFEVSPSQISKWGVPYGVMDARPLIGQKNGIVVTFFRYKQK